MSKVTLKKEAWLPRSGKRDNRWSVSIEDPERGLTGYWSGLSHKEARALKAGEEKKLARQMTVAKVQAYVASIGEDDVAKVMESVYQKHRGTKLSEAQEWLHEGRISQAEYEAYCWLWRNLVFHYSDELIEYQIPSNPIR